ncbi:MAG: efflux RND transporter permease subunit [Akkermansia sp.]|nr:efflux RND transporter permease subunit [Akkermansia sp.]
MSPYFIKHPTIAAVISIVTTLLGVICILGLPVAQYPDIAPITISLSASYPGANATEVAESVATPIEQEISGVDGLDYLSSTSANNGGCELSVNFEPGCNANTCQQLTYMRYSQATSSLPQEVAKMGVRIEQQAGLPILIYTLHSPNGYFDRVNMTGYAFVNMVNPIKRVKGVGNVSVFGAKYAIRIWLDTKKMAQKNISVTEVNAAIAAQNTINPGGSVGAEPMPDGQEFTYTIRNKGRMASVEEFGDISVQTRGTQIVRLRDIAKIELGAENYALTARLSGKTCSAIAIYQAAGSNAIETVDNLRELFAEMQRNMPEGLVGEVTLDTTLSVRESISEIGQTLVEALILVAIVVFLFLQGFRATLIPLLAVPVSLVTTFCFFPLLGFTLNTVCLLGMVLAIGLVVDDAIVVVEAVEAHIEAGMNPREATFAAMREVSGPVVAIALVLAAVFLPSVLLPGITGTLFQQFAVTIAVSMAISAFNALSLSPALSALLLKEKSTKKSLLQPFYNLFNKGYDWLADKFAKCCGFLCRKLYISIPLLAIVSSAIIPVSQRVPGGFLPTEDQGFLISGLIMTPRVSLQRLSQQASTVEQVLAREPAVKDYVAILGVNMANGVQSANAASFFIVLKEMEDRPMVDGHRVTAAEVCASLNGTLAMSGVDGMTFVTCPPAIPGVGTGDDITFVLEDRAGQGVQPLYEQVVRLEAALNAAPEIESGSASDMMMPAVPQKSVTVDRDKCLAQGVDYAQLNAMLQSFNGSAFINYYTQFGQQWQVYVQAAGADRVNTDQIANFYINNSKGEPVPMSTLVTVKDTNDTEFVLHNNTYNAGKINLRPAPGYSSQQAMDAAERIFRETMDVTKFGMSFVDMSFQQKKVADGLGLGAIFTLSGVFAFLIMAALYEKWTLPLAIFLSVPVAVLGAFLGLWLTGMDMNLYAQIGLVMLVGLAAKNAILIVEFAVLQMEKGKDLVEAAIIAARMRLRPILMTSFAFILGCVPLVLAVGSGALSRNAIGIVVVVGMSIASGVGIFFIPCSFVFVMKLFRSTVQKKQTEDPDEISANAKLDATENA